MSDKKLRMPISQEWNIATWEQQMEMKSRKYNYLHSIGRISTEEYEKWILSDDWNFQPKIMTPEEQARKFKLDWGQFHQENSMMWVADPHAKTHELLEELVKQVKISNGLLEEIRRNG